MRTIGKELLARAGINALTIEQGKPDDQFNEILEALKDIHQGKEVLYGNYMETHGAEPKNYSLMQHFMDMKRKYVRADNYIKRLCAGDPVDIVELMDTYSDLAVYSVMGIQMIDHLRKREEKKVG